MSPPAPHSSCIFPLFKTKSIWNWRRQINVWWHCRGKPSRLPPHWSHVPRSLHGMGEGWNKWRKQGRMGESIDVRFDLWKDEMIGDQRAGEGLKGADEGWNTPMGGHMEGEMNGERDERKWKEEWAAVGVGRFGGAYHGKFSSSDWSAEREPSSIMYIMDPWEIFIHIKWSSTRKCLAATA